MAVVVAVIEDEKKKYDDDCDFYDHTHGDSDGMML